jgi:large subunit ribosomal protein L4
MAAEKKADKKKAAGRPAGRTAAAKAPARPKAPAKAKAPAKVRPPAAEAGTTAEEVTAAPGGSGGSVDVVDARNKKVGDVTLRPDVFGVRVNQHLLYEAVKQYQAGARAGTHATKNRALVSGSGRKPWRQKGTGRARVGEIRTPLWRHGGTVFGPQPRDYSYRFPRKMRLAALRSALTQRVKDGALKVIDRFEMDKPKTRVLKGLLDGLGVSGKTLLVDHQPPDNLVLSGRNIPDLKIVDDSHINVYDVLDCKTVLVSSEALSKLEEWLTP